MIQFELYNNKLQIPNQPFFDLDKFDGFTGFYKDLEFSLKQVEEIKNLCKKNSGKKLVVIGIGGSYLTAKAMTEMLTNFKDIIFVGTGFEADYLLKVKGLDDYVVNVVSKSGTTLEVLVSFAFVLDDLKAKFKNYKDRVIITSMKGTPLYNEALENHYEFLEILPSFGGRFSGLSPAGLLPMAFSGIDIFEMLNGAMRQREEILKQEEASAAFNYSYFRFNQEQRSKQIEFLTCMKSEIVPFFDIACQLFMESLGKEGKGLFVAYRSFSEGLHSYGQYLQEGKQNFFETFINYKSIADTIIPKTALLKSYALSSIENLNDVCFDSVLKSHAGRNVPIALITIDEISAFSLGELLVFFQFTAVFCALHSGVNPFNQNGVEIYKEEMRKIIKIL